MFIPMVYNQILIDILHHICIFHRQGIIRTLLQRKMPFRYRKQTCLRTPYLGRDRYLYGKSRRSLQINYWQFAVHEKVQRYLILIIIDLYFDLTLFQIKKLSERNIFTL